MTETIFIQRTESGYSNIQKLESAILSFPKGKKLIVTISDKTRRSDRQNNLWWVYMGILSKETGIYKEDMHELCKYKFLKKEVVDERTGQIFESVGSTTKLTKEDFSEMVDKLIQWSAEMLNIELPPPNAQIEMRH